MKQQRVAARIILDVHKLVNIRRKSIGLPPWEFNDEKEQENMEEELMNNNDELCHCGRPARHRGPHKGTVRDKKVQANTRKQKATQADVSNMMQGGNNLGAFYSILAAQRRMYQAKLAKLDEVEKLLEKLKD